MSWQRSTSSPPPCLPAFTHSTPLHSTPAFVHCGHHPPRYISRIRLPKLLVSAAIALLRIAIQRRGNFDLHDVAPIKAAGSTFVPALFAHADGDDFILPQHSRSSHFTPHTSRLTPHTSHLTPHISHLTPHNMNECRQIACACAPMMCSHLHRNLCVCPVCLR